MKLKINYVIGQKIWLDLSMFRHSIIFQAKTIQNDMIQSLSDI